MKRYRKVMIVDDELLVRIGIRHSVEWEKYGFEIAGEASDGIEAQKMLKQIHPDVMILDINMPNMDGIQVLQKIHQEKDPVKVIVLTCYEELEYARKSLKLGASDYVLKSSIGEEGLVKALKELEFEEEQENEIPGRYLYSQEDALTCILEGHDSNTEVLSVRETHLFCIGIKILRLEQVRKRYAEKKEDFFQVSFRSIVGQVLAGQKECVFLQFQPDLALIYLSFSFLHSTQECSIRIRQLSERLLWALSQYMALQVRIGVSDVHHSYSDIRKSYKEVQEAITYGLLKPEKSVFYYETGAAEKSREEERLQKEIKAQIAAQKYGEALVQMNSCFETITWAEKKKLPGFLQFLEEVIRFISSIEKEEYQEEPVFTELETFEDVKKAVTEKMKKYSVKNDNFLIQKAEEYLRKHYKEQVTLTGLANYMELSESYTSRLFNKETGMNLSTYLNKLRVEEAKRLLRNTKMKIYEIAEETGYSSTTVFHITFKKLEGMTPADYRNLSE